MAVSAASHVPTTIPFACGAAVIICAVARPHPGSWTSAAATWNMASSRPAASLPAPRLSRDGEPRLGVGRIESCPLKRIDHPAGACGSRRNLGAGAIGPGIDLRIGGVDGEPRQCLGRFAVAVAALPVFRAGVGTFLASPDDDRVDAVASGTKVQGGSARSRFGACSPAQPGSPARPRRAGDRPPRRPQPPTRPASSSRYRSCRGCRASRPTNAGDSGLGARPAGPAAARASSALAAIESSARPSPRSAT